MYLEYPTQALKAKGNFETQCIKIDDRAYGALNETEGRGEFPTNDSYLGEAHMRLACGNSGRREPNARAAAMPTARPRRIWT